MIADTSAVDFEGALPQLDGTLTVEGVQAAVTIRRDRYGIAHIKAASEHDAWFGQGYASAQDRLWQMEYDRRRAVGRWAEAAGGSAVPADVLARRMQLRGAAEVDVEAMSSETRGMFEAYAAGVNSFLGSGQPLPVEYALTGLSPEPWEPWHSVASFKIRHVLMGKWQLKLARASLLARIGSERFARLDDRAPVGSRVILRPGGRLKSLFRQAAEDIEAAAEHLGFLGEVDGGSNSWVVHGSRTTTGVPVLCNDAHRALDVPNVYWQVHVDCPGFNVIGGTFPGVPGFPHFAHNGSVGWNITHTGADYQDLYIEQFDPDEPSRYRTPGGWADAVHDGEEIVVRGEAPRPVELWRTRHGPIVHGDPTEGYGLALRYTATDQPCRGFEALRPMLSARTVEELHEAMRPWVDPVNNLVAADNAGNIGYLTRGRIPIRSSDAARQLPAPGWTGEHEWTGDIPFEDLPRSINPPEGYIATANQAVLEGDEPYIAHEFAVPSRAERLVEVLNARDDMSPEEIADLQGDTTSWPARQWVSLLARVGPFDDDAEAARALLASWDGNLLPESGPALLYANFRRTIARAMFEPVVGPDTWRWMTSGAQPSAVRMISGWLANVVWGLGDSEGAPDGRAWDAVLPDALASAYRAAVESGGEDPTQWRWDAVHRTNARHTLSGAFPELAERLNPPPAHVGGDGDTVQAAGFGYREGTPFHIAGLSVYRQVVDLADIEHGSFVVPGGASGLPGTAHFADQLELWATHQRVPMHYRDEEIDANTTARLELLPA